MVYLETESQEPGLLISDQTSLNPNTGASNNFLPAFHRLPSEHPVQGIHSAIPSLQDSHSSVDMLPNSNSSTHTNAAITRRPGVEYSSLLQTQGNAMRVYVRVRPYNEREISQQNMSQHSTVRVDPDNPCMITLLDPNHDFRSLTTYSFTRCFWSVFEQSSENSKTSNHNTIALCDTVDAYLNRSVNKSQRFCKSGSPLLREKVISPRSLPGVYVQQKLNQINVSVSGSSGSKAVIVETNVSHPAYASQAEVYRHVGRPILENALDGYNGCIFAYGQTGSGKTFTMLGYAPDTDHQSRVKQQNVKRTSTNQPSGRIHAAISPHCDNTSISSKCDCSKLVESPRGNNILSDKFTIDPNELQGIIPRISADIFHILRLTRERDASCSYRVEVSYLEIYQDKLYDLIRPHRSSDLKIRHNPASGPYVEGLCYKNVMSEADISTVLHGGIQERHTAATKFNDRSSRGHAILSFNIMQVFLDGCGSPSKVQGKLNLVDLAGSERAGQSGVDRPEYNEGVKINQSLTVLGRVIDCLADLSQNKSLAVPVPYRDSKLTLILMNSIGGNSQTSMIATISPHMMNYEEMKQTLRYASRAKQILNRSVRNEDPQVVLIRELRSEVGRLQKLLKEAGSCGYTLEYVLGLEQEVVKLTKKLTSQEEMLATLRAELEGKGLAHPTRRESCKGEITEESTCPSFKDTVNASQQDCDITQKDVKKMQASPERKFDMDDACLLTSREPIPRPRKDVAYIHASQVLDHSTTTRLLWQHIIQSFSTFANHIRRKEDIIISAFQAMQLRAFSEIAATAKILKSEHVYEISMCKKQFQRKMETQVQRLERKLREAIEERTLEQQQLTSMHKQALTQLEEQMQFEREIHSEKIKHMEKEKEEMLRHKDAELSRDRELQHQEIKRLCSMFDTTMQDSQQSVKELQRTCDSQARELNKLHNDLECLKRAKELEISHIKQQFDGLQLRSQSELCAKEHQCRRFESELANLHQHLETLELENAKKQFQYEENMNIVLQRQEDMITASNAVLKAWEDRSETLAANLSRLQGLLCDQDYVNLCQRIRDSPFQQRINYEEALRDVDERQRRDAEKFLEILSRAKKTQQEHQASLEKYQQEVQHWRRSPNVEK